MDVDIYDSSYIIVVYKILEEIPKKLTDLRLRSRFPIIPKVIEISSLST